MRITLALVILLFSLFVLGQIWIFSGKNREVAAEAEELRQSLVQAQNDHRGLQSDYEFYLSPVNLEKELRARFNFRAPGEKTIILVPQAAPAL